MIRDNYLAIKARIAARCLCLGRDPGLVAVIAVSKERSVENIIEAVADGIYHFGESRVQEALIKSKKLFTVRDPRFEPGAVRWHMVGHLQANKAKQAVSIFDLIHSVDSVKLSVEINSAAAKINKIQDILIQVNTSFEATKFGIRPESLIPMVREIFCLKNISLKGLMTIVPMAENPEIVRPYFRELKNLLDKANAIRDTHDEMRILSMGMSDDFEVAVDEGATMVRIGRGIFENQ